MIISGRPILLEPKIVKVRPTTPVISLTWMIGARCNYDCMYCPTDLHDDTSPHADLQKLKTAWHSFYSKTKHTGLPHKISFTGGEVTANKSFLPFVEYLRAGDFNIGQLLVTTNGSASARYYQHLANAVDAISFSTHSEFFNESEFFSKVIAVNHVMIRPKKSVHVNIMDESWNQDRIEIYTKLLSTNNISYSVNSIDYSQQTRTTPILQGKFNLDKI
jgi:molybdenum cofactor biosynthesis enzyme MoaA